MLRLGVLTSVLLTAPAAAQNADIVVTGRGLPEAIGEDVYDVIVIDRERLR